MPVVHQNEVGTRSGPVAFGEYCNLLGGKKRQDLNDACEHNYDDRLGNGLANQSPMHAQLFAKRGHCNEIMLPLYCVIDLLLPCTILALL